MQIKFLGTSGSIITAKRTNSSVLIDNDLLIDVGEGTTQKLLQFGSLKDIRTILISHLHVDHFLGIFSFLWHQWLAERDSKPIIIYGPPDIRSTTEAILQMTASPVEAFPFEIQYIPLDPQETILKLGQISTTRLQHHIYTLGYRIERDKSVCYATDTAPLERVSLLAKNCDILIHDTSFPNEFAEICHSYHHSTPRDAAEIATKANVKILVLFHVLGIMENKIDIYVKDAKQFFDGEIILAEEMKTLDL